MSFSESVEVTELDQDLTNGGNTEEVTGEIEEEKIDQLLHILHEADPTGDRPDDHQLPHLEGRGISFCILMSLRLRLPINFCM